MRGIIRRRKRRMGKEKQEIPTGKLVEGSGRGGTNLVV
jgi:hypothetical protein